MFNQNPPHSILGLHIAVGTYKNNMTLMCDDLFKFILAERELPNFRMILDLCLGSSARLDMNAGVVHPIHRPRRTGVCFDQPDC